MDKNMAALLRADARTVHVSFDPCISAFDEIGETPLAKPKAAAPKGFAVTPAVKLYTYVTSIAGLKRGDAVIVPARGEFQIAYVESVDADVEIEPNSDTFYKWVIDRVDMAAHKANMDRNAEIEAEMSKAYRNNMRRSFAANILAGVGDDQRAKLLELTGATDTLG